MTKIAAPVAAFLLANSLVSAIPTKDHPRRGTFSVQQVERLVPKLASPPQELVDAAKEHSSVDAEPIEFDELYYSPVTIGGQELHLDFDTGSADTWVFSTLTSPDTAAGHQLYDPEKSETAKKLEGYKFDILYGDLSGASGDVYTDDVTIGDHTAKSQAFGVPQMAADQFDDEASREVDGLLGLAFGSSNTISPKMQPTFFDNIADNLKSRLFTVDLKAGQKGSYDFGYIDESKYPHGADISWVPVNNVTGEDSGRWSFEAGNTTQGDQPHSLGYVGNAILDTGTTGIMVQPAVAQKYWNYVPGAQFIDNVGHIVPCDAELPSFNTEIAGRWFHVPGEYLKHAPYGDGYHCHTNLVSTGLYASFAVYGDTFLKAVFAVFDESQDQPRIGLVEKDLP